MALLLNRIVEFYHYVDHDLADPRTSEHYIVRNPFFLATVVILYRQFVTSWGPKFMENRPAYKLDRIIRIYNIFQIIVNIYVFVKSIELVWWSGYYNIICQPICWDDTPIERAINSVCWLYHMIKISDLLDTVFFVLRKKYNQASFLHIYHHIGMVCGTHIAIKYVPAGQGALLGTINSFVHAVMYFYYLLSSMSPEYKKSIWWKKHLTQLQIVQFLYLMVHFSIVVVHPNCSYPMWVSMIFIPQNLFMLLMFSDFYIKNYIKKKQ